MSENRTLEEIELELQQAREALTASVNELSARLTPAALAEDAKAHAKAKVNKAKSRCANLVKDAKSGDPKALAILVGGVALVSGFVVLKIAHR